MKDFKAVRFCGTFRDYQTRVLEHADDYLKDGKINIVAAPGSGKTVLGLELIRRIGKPCLILSPTTAIRTQWGERFRTMFLKNEVLFPDYFSSDLHTPRLLMSVTYQALYCALEKVTFAEEGEADCSDVDLFRMIRENGIKTICLDEAHHLKNEWQKALENFLSLLDGDVKIISLTATPPYDSEGTEWNRYVSLCGEIDEEIFVPELVAQSTLCPHQDYIYFNYPDAEETRALQTHRENAVNALVEIRSLDLMRKVCSKICLECDAEFLFTAVKEHIALLVLFRYFDYPIPKKVIRMLTVRKGLPVFQMPYAETALQYLLNGALLTEEEKDVLTRILKRYSVYDKRRVVLHLSEKLKRSLISSVGKLESIRQIVSSEAGSLGNELRMLILTDYIKKEEMELVGTDGSFHSVSIVSIFETLRRENEDLCIGVLSGSLVILPEQTELSAYKHSRTSISGTKYCIVNFVNAAQNAVKIVSELFEKGKIQVLIGTKSLLGEGWDSPCINSLILASFVGSYVLSNQMRGRAIRMNQNNPNKVSNIWHLVTVEPEYLFQEKLHKRLKSRLLQNPNELQSWDYELLKRRFDAFMGPNDESGNIESGIERMALIEPPYNAKGIAYINKTMLALAENRDAVREKWNAQVSKSGFSVAVENEIPKEKKIPVFTFYNIALFLSLSATEIALLQALIRSAASLSSPLMLIMIAAEGVCLYGIYCILKKLILHCNPANSFRTLGNALLNTLQECNLISSGARLESENAVAFVRLSLRNASIHDQNVFNKAISELLSPIENPRYLLIRKSWFRRFDYRYAFACPSVLGKKKEYAETLARNLKGNTGTFETVFAHREDGRKLILKCRRKAFITYNQKILTKKYKVSHWE